MKTIRELSDEHHLNRSTLLKSAQHGKLREVAKQSGSTWLIDETSVVFHQWLVAHPRQSRAKARKLDNSAIAEYNTEEVDRRE